MPIFWLDVFTSKTYKKRLLPPTQNLPIDSRSHKKQSKAPALIYDWQCQSATDILKRPVIAFITAGRQTDPSQVLTYHKFISHCLIAIITPLHLTTIYCYTLLHQMAAAAAAIIIITHFENCFHAPHYSRMVSSSMCMNRNLHASAGHQPAASGKMYIRLTSRL